MSSSEQEHSGRERATVSVMATIHVKYVLTGDRSVLVIVVDPTETIRPTLNSLGLQVATPSAPRGTAYVSIS